ncbi:ribosome-assembly protein [Rhizoctonia solani AG-3 Rhs1AP]|uniref:Ribosome assembly protein 3 n=1 Tax=Rhizoctonia solani AG-3 Rhs1AP TaxID=1086054 RepID=X8JU71_9AGAM|nr:ribosome-assembly protein [Rhizoctonia solani AG-3 Rhs1AP]
MPLAKAATIPTRKRNRKRKRRAASSSSSASSSASSSSEDESPQVTTISVSGPAATPKVIVRQDDSDSESDSDDSASSTSSSSVRSTSPRVAVAPESIPKPKRRRDSHSPSPPPTDLPSFLPPAGTENARKREEELKVRFRKFWMASVADGFRADLEELHKEPNLTESRLSLLIDSLASGADVFMSAPAGNSSRGLESISGVNEMEVVLDGTA